LGINQNAHSGTFIKVLLTFIIFLLIINTVVLSLQVYWTYIANEEKIENFHDSEYRKQKEQEEKIKELEKKIEEMAVY
jgi:hypothetical protein